MTRKDYELIAKALKAVYKEVNARWSPNTNVYVIDKVIDTLARSLAKDNPRFNPARFRAAANLD